jgi:hypothetical protein
MITSPTAGHEDERRLAAQQLQALAVVMRRRGSRRVGHQSNNSARSVRLIAIASDFASRSA